jgi:predicted short-subunit dehydrogenase-like oxidoreductase (DUF2520 family)
VLADYALKHGKARTIVMARKSIRAAELHYRSDADIDTLFDSARGLYYVIAEMPFEAARKAIFGIARETVNNIETLGFARALTGPIARGDLAFVEKQYRALQAIVTPNVLKAYREYGQRTLDFALRENILTGGAASAIRRVLNPVS